MKNKPVLLILSDNRDFIEPLSNLVTRELKLIPKTIGNEAEIGSERSAVLVTDRRLEGSYSIPVINVSLPIRINNLFVDIEIALLGLETIDMLQITPELSLSLQNKTLSDSKGAFAQLTDKESQLLQIIAEAEEVGVSKEILLKEVWKIEAVLDTHTLETHIYRLRKKIKDAFGCEMIKANDGGYKL